MAKQPAVSSTRPSSQSSVSRNTSSLRSRSTRNIGTIIGKRGPSVTATKKQAAVSQRSRQEKPPSRVGRTLPNRSTSNKKVDKVGGVREPKAAARGTVGNAAGRTIGRTAGRDTRIGTDRIRADVDRKHKSVGLRDATVSRNRDSSISGAIAVPQGSTIVGGSSSTSLYSATTGLHTYDVVRPSSIVYYDQPHLIRHSYHHDYYYRDYYNRICRRSIWPRYRFALYYNCGPWFTFRYVYPYYHRKYLFVSLGGYWPLDYQYTRYYWYGCHPYYWYGYYPVPREVPGTSYSYYTYNYYSDGDSGYQPATIVNPEIYENIGEQTAEPQEATLADIYFEEAVKAFEVAQYNTAALKFYKAFELAPEDTVLPFAYAQALIASQQYSRAAEVLRGALEKVNPEKEGVFFPRGLYPDEETLLKHIDRLAERAAQFSYDADLQLLLGYQLLGIGQHDRAVEPLMNAGKDLKNAKAAGVLMDLLEKVKTVQPKAETSAPAETTAPAPALPIKPDAPAPIKSPTPAPSEAIVPSQEPALKVGKAAIRDRSTQLGGAMVVTSLCALGTSFGIGHFVRG